MKKKIQNGIYLIIDPSMNRAFLWRNLKEIIKEEIAAVQIWDNFNTEENLIEFINEIVNVCHTENIPVLINNHWELLNKTKLDGIHFDHIPNNLEQLKLGLKREIITGITCNNDLSTVKWANENKVNYISFCSMFPSSTTNSCELVDFNTVTNAEKITHLPIFLAGGITPDNIDQLKVLNYSGIAVISGIMNSSKPIDEIKKYNQKIRAK